VAKGLAVHTFAGAKLGANAFFDRTALFHNDNFFVLF
jgi:hypothetical protein